MLGNRNYVYESKCNKILQKDGLLPRPLNWYGSKTSGSFAKDGREYKLEYKSDFRTELCQVPLLYENNRWCLAQTTSPENSELMDAVGAESIINSILGWGKKSPNKYTVEEEALTKELATEDYRNFTNKYIDVPRNAFNSYYGKKDIYYIQIDGLGFYYMSDNPAKLNVPPFDPYLRIRVRIKTNGSGIMGKDYKNYGFIATLLATIKPTQSNSDIIKNTDFLKA